MKRALCTFCFTVGSALAAPQLSKDLSDYPPPRPPLVNPAPAMGQWTITLQNGATSEASLDKETVQAAAEKKKKDKEAQGTQDFTGIQSIKTGSLKQDVVTRSSGKAETVWFSSDYVLLPNPTSPAAPVIVQRASVLDEPTDEIKGVFRELGSPSLSPGFPGFRWLQLSRYDGLVWFNKTIPCYHYILKGKDPGRGVDVVASEAWVNAETGLPVAYTVNGNIYVYNFGPVPTSQLALPQEYAAAENKLKRNIEHRRQLEIDAGR